MNFHSFSLCALLSLWLTAAVFPADPVAAWDFTRGTHAWTGNARVETLNSTPDGLVVNCLGKDPWIEGPAFDAPAGAMLRVTVTMKSSASPAAQFFYGPSFVPGRSRSFVVQDDGHWHTYFVMLPKAGGPRTRLRLDPCDGEAHIVVRSIGVEAIRRPKPPVFAKPSTANTIESPHAVRAGNLRLAHDPKIWNGLRLRFGEKDLAAGYDGEQIGVMIGDQPEYLALHTGELHLDGTQDLTASVRIRDRGGATWSVIRRFKPRGPGDGIEVTTTIAVDRDREAVLLPWFTLLPGHASHGARKHQGLFAGVEYLADEPSSSETDLTGPQHLRRVPDPVMITFPLMAIAHDGHYVGLIWDRSAPVAAGFDSPDRVFGSGAHAMWLSAPPVGPSRFANDLVAHTPMELRANDPISTTAVIIGGRGQTVASAVQHYVARHPLPVLPVFDGGYQRAIDLLARGWMDSAIRHGWQFKHADWMGRFPPHPAADAAMHLSFLAQHSSDSDLAARLREGSRQSLAELPPSDPHASSVSHVRLPSPPLVFGRFPEFLAQRKRQAFALLARFGPDGTILYRPGKQDYSRTHFEKHANGLGATVLAEILEAATLCADEELITQALAVLDKQTAAYGGTVPRGAQTWEIPLHTPDILASAHLVRAYAFGYILSGRKSYLEQARYWAWTGVPFVYLVNPTDGECGPYATIAVLGATNWTAPVWLGLPVQWCGLVYGSALHLLARIDPEGPWNQLAMGITRAGLQMTWPTTDHDRQGLLPDFYHLVRQVSDGPAINPGTLGAHLPEAFGKGRIYDLHRFSNGWIAHAPCAIEQIEDGDGHIRFELAGWGEQPYHLVLAGVADRPADLRVNERVLEARHDPGSGVLVVPLQGPARILIANSTP